ncbi:MAG: PAS domain S-box protein [Candidatus Obscuribacterales bacterium]|nr:PAS domain S-box protein [Candidatus Obscuribacterales bacterium]
MAIGMETEPIVNFDTLRLILDNMVDGVIVADDQCNFIVYNSKAQEIIGRNVTDSKQEGWPSYFGIFKSDQITLCPSDELPMTRAIRGETVFQEEAWIRNENIADGVWVSINATPLRNEMGTIVGGVGVFRDITSQKQAAQKIEQAAQDLAKSHKELQNLAFAVSHELQGPISIVTSYLNLLSIRYKDRLGADADEFIDKVVNASKIIERMLDDLWIYARINKQETEAREISLTGLVDDLLNEMHSKIEKNRVTVTREILPIVRGHKAQLHYLFKAVLDNAIDFQKPECPPQIDIRVNEESESFWFSIEDNGIGIKQDECREIFNLFHRIHGKPEGGRTGMGLPIAKKIVEHHGGQIYFESLTGSGSVIRFSLPKTDA